MVPTLTITATNETVTTSTANEPTAPLTQEPTERYKSLKIKTPNSQTATDVYYFVRALDSEEEPTEKPTNEPILNLPPKSRYLGCKLCT